MTWTTLLRETFEYQYAVADKLMDLVEDAELGWKPATGSNWMTVGQLLYHIPEACGQCVRGFVTGDWGMPAGDQEHPPLTLPASEGENAAMEGAMLPTAEMMKAVASVEEAKKLLAADKQVAFEMLAQCSEERLETEIARAPWDTMEMSLGQRMLEMAIHLQQHKGQLFYYLKLQGKPVNTMHLWGV